MRRIKITNRDLIPVWSVEGCFEVVFIIDFDFGILFDYLLDQNSERT